MNKGGIDKSLESVLTLSLKEAELITELRKLPYGEFNIKVYVRKGEPTKLFIQPCESREL